MYGLELTEWNPNGHDGSYEDINYFPVKQGYGFFAKSDFITGKISEPPSDLDITSSSSSTCPPQKKLLALSENGVTMEQINEFIKEGTPPDYGEKENCNLNINGYTLSDVHFGNRVLLTNGLAGSIRFMGKVDFDCSVWLGIDLKKKNCNGHNGIVGGRKYFEPKEHCGYFIKMNEIERILPSKSQKQKKKKKKKKKRKCLKNFPKLGDRVKVVNGRIGVVEFIGVICLVKDICIGLTLDTHYEYGNDGSVQGRRYFTCDKGRGYFVRLQHLIENFGTTLGENGQEKALEMGKGVNIGYILEDKKDIKDIEMMKEMNDNGNIKMQSSDMKREGIVFKSGVFEQGFYRIREKLKEIEMLEERLQCGFFLFPTQFKKIAKREEYEKAIIEIKNGTWIPPPPKKDINDDEQKEKEEEEEEEQQQEEKEQEEQKEVQEEQDEQEEEDGNAVDDENNEDDNGNNNNNNNNDDPFDVLDDLLDLGYKMVENENKF